MECKLLTSVFYDLGKGLAERNSLTPDIRNEETNNYFMKAVHEFLLTFPILNGFATTSNFKVPIGTNKMSCLAFLRMNARSGFLNGLKGKKT